MGLSNYQQLQQGQSKFQQLQNGPTTLLSNTPAKRVGGVRRRDETNDQMQQRLYGPQQNDESFNMIFQGPAQNQQPFFDQSSNNGLNEVFPGADNQNLSNYQQAQQGLSSYQKLQQTPFGQGSLVNRPRNIVGGVRRQGESRSQMQQRLGSFNRF